MNPRADQKGIAKMQPYLRQLLIAGSALLAINAIGVSASYAADTAPKLVTANAPAGVARSVKVGLNKSLVIDLPRDARDILVSNPVIADAVIRTPRRIYITGVAVGQSNVIVFDRAGQQIVSLDLSVERDPSTLAAMVNRLLPDSNITVEIVSDNIILSGYVKNAADARKAQDIASIFANGGSQAPQGPEGTSASGGTTPISQVVNMLTIQGEDQVQLKVTVAEVNRNVVKQLGVNWDIQNLSVGSLILSAASNLPFPINGAPDNPTLGGTYSQGGGSSGTVEAMLQALQQTGMLKVLAEPTLTSISGESASFLAGGSFPYRVSDGNGGFTTAFKDFGVSLGMTPVVLSDGRISLRMKTEVSQLSPENSSADGTGLAVRRAETTLELPSGGSMVLGGLLQDTVRQSINEVPGLGKLPILGPLFRSRDFQRSETELVIIATPYLVKPVSRSQLATPDQGLGTPSDAQSVLFGNINRIYSGGGQTGGQKYQGRVGYIYE